jgi:hypothetical protein
MVTFPIERLLWEHVGLRRGCHEGEVRVGFTFDNASLPDDEDDFAAAVAVILRQDSVALPD